MTDYEKELLANIEGLAANSKLTRNEHIYFQNALQYLNQKFTEVKVSETKVEPKLESVVTNEGQAG